MSDGLFSRRAFVAALGCIACDQGASEPDVVMVAVASNFVEPLERLARLFETASQSRVRTSTGSSGKLLAQIENGAPYHVFLSADRERPERLERRGLAVAGSRFTYALGALALYGPAVTAGEPDVAKTLRTAKLTHLAIANPDTAPYGRAAKEVLDRLDLYRPLEQKLVRGESIAQTMQFVQSGAAELGFVARAQVVGASTHPHVPIPQDLHAPIAQDAVLLARGRDHGPARALLTFLGSKPAREVIERAGYGVP